MLASGTTASLRGIHAVSSSVAWASGTEGTILRTIDGGTHWTRCTTPPDAAKLDFRGIQAWDADTAFVLSSGPGPASRLFKTTDACKTWIQQMKEENPAGFWDLVAFQHGNYQMLGDEHTGVMIGDPLDGRFQTFSMVLGHGWFVDSAGCAAKPEEAAFAASNSSAVVFGSRRYVLGTGGKGGASVLISPLLSGKIGSDACTRIVVPIAGGTASAGIFSLAVHTDTAPFRNVISTRETLVAVGGDYIKPGESAGTAAYSTDRGLTWHAAATPPHGYRSSVAYSEAAEAWIAVGTNGSDISRDEGKTWSPLEDPIMANGNWNALSLPFVVAPHGRIGRLQTP